MASLIRNNRGQVVCYTDGACTNNGYYNAKAGYAVVFGINHDWNKWGPVEGRDTNNVAEIEGAINAVDVAGSHGLRNLLIRTDSQFLVDAYNEWIPEWSSSGWRKNDGSEVINRKEFQELVRTIKYYGMAVELEHVRGHQKDQLNIEADRLAKLGAQGKSSQ